jgi:hypothetical protein
MNASIKRQGACRLGLPRIFPENELHCRPCISCRRSCPRGVRAGFTARHFLSAGTIAQEAGPEQFQSLKPWAGDARWQRHARPECCRCCARRYVIGSHFAPFIRRTFFARWLRVGRRGQRPPGPVAPRLSRYQFEQFGAFGHLVARRVEQLGHHAVSRGGNGVFHFHGVHHGQRLAFGDLVARFHGE